MPTVELKTSHKMRFVSFVAAFVLTCLHGVAGTLEPRDLRCEYLEDPLGVDVVRPRLTWELAPVSEGRSLRQSAYRVIVASSRASLDLNRGDLWDSGRVASDQSVNVLYGGPSLHSRQQCFWKVMAWDQGGEASNWSGPARWTMGLLQPADWRARWITAPEGTGPDKPVPWFRKVFSLGSRPLGAFAYVASVGYHELYINGHKAGDGVLTPSVSHLGRRARYLTYDLSGALQTGDNCIGLWLGNGWASHAQYGPASDARVVAQLEVALDDGSTVTVATDGSWATHASPITGIGKWRARQFGGERYDARNEMPDWSLASANASGWKTAAVSASPAPALSAEMIEPNRLVRTLKPAGITRLPDGASRVDMGQSFTGWFEMPLSGPEGSEISLEFSEREDEPVTYGQRDVYVCSGKQASPFRSRFNYHTFRWVTIRGLEAAPKPDQISGYLVRTGYRPAASFESSDDLLNRIYRMTASTYESLSLGGYLVDCPHRERLGYGGDAHATMETGLSQFLTGAFYTKWLQDWRDSQEPSGEMPHTAPQIGGGGGPAWGGISVVLPWETYRRLGDRQILEVSYPSMQRWLAFLESRSKGGLLRPFTSFSTPGQAIWSFLGDWVPPGRGQSPGQRVDEPSTLFFNNCYWLLNLRIAAKSAELLGHTAEAGQYEARATRLARELHEKFFDREKKIYANGEPTYLVFPLATEVVPEPMRADVLEQLVKRILVTDKGHINTGMHGTWLLYRYLSAIGRDDLLLTMMRQMDYPGWGYMVRQGATTVWEEWNGDNSRLHSTLMGAGQWFTEGIAGIRPDDAAPGYKRFVLKPSSVGDLLFVRAGFHSPYGEIGSDWTRDGDEFRWRVTIPPNTTATVYVPTREPDSVMEGGAPAGEAVGVKSLRTEKQLAVYEVGSGEYEFISRAPR